jgi:hypothetical protein
MEVAVDADRSVVAQLEKTTTPVYKPKLAWWSSGGHLIDGKNPADNNTLFDIALLRDEKNLVSRARRAGQPPAISDPLRNYGKPTGQDPFGLMSTRAVALFGLTDVPAAPMVVTAFEMVSPAGVVRII